ncbi:hypothetical protein [Paenibacillus vini]|uniref:RNase H type-1 domain-containing protein n=1 Tax=Paenibacillus vini TaxID=1476024 RepID=A0ABQ4M9D7_9BACL|nr:hypothetical protein [Paenibacillus vini]GIP52030.1 hypothetical protein J42TS3_10650 [Paenibacillus vini]
MSTRTQKNKRSKQVQKNKQSALPLLQGNKKLELVVAALLLTGRLKVDSIQLYTDSSLFVSLVGKFKTLNNDTVDKLVNFMNENGDITLNDFMEALKKKTGNS